MILFLWHRYRHKPIRDAWALPILGTHGTRAVPKIRHAFHILMTHEIIHLSCICITTYTNYKLSFQKLDSVLNTIERMTHLYAPWLWTHSINENISSLLERRLGDSARKNILINHVHNNKHVHPFTMQAILFFYNAIYIKLNLRSNIFITKYIYIFITDHIYIYYKPHVYIIFIHIIVVDIDKETIASDKGTCRLVIRPIFPLVSLTMSTTIILQTNNHYFEGTKKAYARKKYLPLPPSAKSYTHPHIRPPARPSARYQQTRQAIIGMTHKAIKLKKAEHPP